MGVGTFTHSALCMHGPALAIFHISSVLLPVKQKLVSPILWRLNKIKQFVQGQPVREAGKETEKQPMEGRITGYYCGN